MEPNRPTLQEAARSGRLLLDRLIVSMRTEHGVHIESLATAVGALAGHACLVASQQLHAQGDPEFAKLAHVAVGGRNGDSYVFGDLTNRLLVDAPDSVWSLLSSKILALGGELPDIAEILTNASTTAGSDQFGRPRYPKGTEAAQTPRQYLALWESAQFLITANSPNPRSWPAAYTFAMLAAIELSKGTANLTVIGRIFMDSAVAMARLDTGP